MHLKDIQNQQPHGKSCLNDIKGEGGVGVPVEGKGITGQGEIRTVAEAALRIWLAHYEVTQTGDKLLQCHSGDCCDSKPIEMHTPSDSLPREHLNIRDSRIRLLNKSKGSY